MATGKKSFVLYISHLDYIDKLSDRNAGILFKAILSYVNGGTPTLNEHITKIYAIITDSIEQEWAKFNPKTGRYHWNYKGGISPENKVIRNSIEIKLWRLKCLVRDKYTCQICGKKGGTLNVHHVKEFSKHPDLRTEVSNGQTVCKPCHLKIHSKNG